MTSNTSVRRLYPNLRALYTLICLLLAALMIIFSESIKRGIFDGFVFSFKTIIPTIFPFFILSDLWSAHFTLKNRGIISRLFEKLFNINGVGISAFLSGLVCGFPIGVKIASELYKSKKITKEEFERLSGFVNNPSAAFIISGVGLGIIGDFRVGIFLYISIVLSAITVGILFRGKKKSTTYSTYISRQSFNLIDSVKNAAITSISVAAYITFFCGVISVIREVIPYEPVLLIITSFLEVSNSTKLIASAQSVGYFSKLALIGFSLGFSGFSVHMQAMSFFDGTKAKSYLFMKLIQGLFSLVYVYIFAFLFLQ